jgi:hypothetical protein
VIWLNERAEDFCLYSELEKAYYKYHRKLDVSCIIERDLFGHALASNQKLRDAVPPYRVGECKVACELNEYTCSMQPAGVSTCRSIIGTWSFHIRTAG